MNATASIPATCPDEPTLRMVCLGTANQELTEQVLSHVETCPACPSRIDALWQKAFDHPSTAQNSALPRHQPPASAPRSQRLASLLVRTGGQPDLSFLKPSPHAGMLGRLGPYDIVRLIGSGGVGLVFEAVDSCSGQSCALKCLRPDRLASAEIQQRFLREAATPRAIGHPGVPPILDQGIDGEVPYLVMPLLQGCDFRTLIHQAAPMPPEEVVCYLAQICDILQAAHGRGIVHRDIKPSNLWLEKSTTSTNTRVLLLDYGLTTLAQQSTQLTQTGDMLGTPAYFSPEQADGFARGATPATDLFSFGAVAFEMLTGRRVFPGQTPLEILRNMAHFKFASPKELVPAVPQPLSDLVMRLLAWAPDKRPSAALALDQLQNPALLRDPWLSRRAAVRLAVTGGSVAAIAGICGTAWWLADRARRTRPGKAGVLALAPTRTFTLPGAITFDFNKLGDFNTEPNTVYWANPAGEFGTLPIDEGKPVTVGRFNLRPTDLRAGIRNLLVCDASGRLQCHDMTRGQTSAVLPSPFSQASADKPGPFLLWSGNFGRFLTARGNRICLVQMTDSDPTLIPYAQEFGGESHITSLLHYPPGVESLRPFAVTMANGWLGAFGMPQVQGYDRKLITEGIDFRLAFDPTGTLLAVCQANGENLISTRIAHLANSTEYRLFRTGAPDGTTALVTPVDVQFGRKKDLVALLGRFGQKGTLSLYSRSANRTVARVRVDDPIEMEIRGADLWVLDSQGHLHHFDQFEDHWG